jgi:hypothetical protein
VKRALAWFAGLVGVAALGRMLSRRRRAASPIASDGAQVTAEHGPDAAETAADPAEELRRRLAAQRGSEPASGVEGDHDVPTADESLDERRARVHAKAREAMDAMRDEGPAA